MPADRLFNSYLLRASEAIFAAWGKRGYALQSYTHDLHLGPILLKATQSPLTMCVAAQMEIIVEALNLYVTETGDTTPYSYLPPKHWQSLRPSTLRDLVWVNSGSKGTADALEKFGMGQMCKFEELTPGAFINFNRNNRTGHAAMFLEYIDERGTVLPAYGPNVAGFKYFSSQGKRSDGGFDYRLAFFGDKCPVVAGSIRRDCGVIRSTNPAYLCSGHMLMPAHWNPKQRDQSITIFDISAESEPENSINPAYVDQVTTDD